MASSPSTEAADIRRRGRHRLIGAIAIVAVLVIFVPMVFDSEPRAPQPEPSLEIPAKDKVAPLPTSAKKVETAPVAPTPSKDGAQSGPTPSKDGAQLGPGLRRDGTQDSTPKVEGFAVQVGAFKDEDKLKQARDKLTAAGLSHFVERRDTPGGPLNRLRAGPYPTREAAEKALAAVKAASLDGQVVPLP